MSNSAILILNRASGLLLWGPSFQGNLAIMNCVFTSHIRNHLQWVVFASTLLSMAVDMLMLISILGWFIDNNWSMFTPLVVGLGTIKRIYSICSVAILYRRFEALIQRKSKVSHLGWYVLGYTILSLSTAAIQFACYYTNNWDSLLTRDSDLFKYAYRITNIITSSYYFFIGFFTDIHFLLLGKTSATIANRLALVKGYYNLYIYLAYEVVLYIAFVVTILWSFVSADVISSIYIEQCLLTYSTLNAFYSVFSSSGSEAAQVSSSSYQQTKPRITATAIIKKKAIEEDSKNNSEMNSPH